MIHVDGNGTARLLKEVIQLWKEGTRIPDPENPGPLPGRRAGAVRAADRREPDREFHRRGAARRRAGGLSRQHDRLRLRAAVAGHVGLVRHHRHSPGVDHARRRGADESFPAQVPSGSQQSQRALYAVSRRGLSGLAHDDRSSSPRRIRPELATPASARTRWAAPTARRSAGCIATTSSVEGLFFLDRSSGFAGAE